MSEEHVSAVASPGEGAVAQPAGGNPARDSAPTPEFVLRSSQFRREREASWRDLEALLERVEHRGIGALTHDELTRLPTLYRSAVGALSVARSISLDRNLLDYLTHLTTRAHLAVYAGRRRPLEAVGDFVTRRFPSIVRGFRLPFALALASLCLGVLIGFVMTQRDPERFYSFVSEGMSQGRTPEAPTDSLRATLYRPPQNRGELEVFATFLFSHNALVGILCLALGFAAGAPVIFLLFSNGLILGAMAALFGSRGLGPAFWAWVLPHGVTEMLAVVLCGMSGLVFGASIVFPSQGSRLATLARRGRDAGLAVLGAVGMLFIAAMIEGLFRQLVHDTGARWAVAIVSAAGWILYFMWAGREADR